MGSAPPPTKQHQEKYRGANTRVNHNDDEFLVEWKIANLPSGQ
jgi:hypothetical protein